MKVLVFGASGATGFNVVTQLIAQNIDVKGVARSTDKFKNIMDNRHLEIIQASILEVDDKKVQQYLADVDAVVTCLGHNLTFKGLFGKPRTLVVAALAKVVNCISQLDTDKTIKLVLMSTTACINKQQNERFHARENFVVTLLRYLLPPHRDNELTLDYLLNKVGTKFKNIEWVAVRPDGLINEPKVTEYTACPSTIRSPIFDSGKVSRINVANFMVNLLINDKLWDKWKYKTPVLYNSEDD